MRALDLRLESNCRERRDRRAVAWTVARVTETLTDARLAQIRAAGQPVPGATLVSGLAGPRARSVSVTAPGFRARRVTLSRRSRAFTTVYPAALESGRIVIRATVRGRRSTVGRYDLTRLHR